MISSPEVTILKQAKAVLDTIDFATAIGYPDLGMMTVRHSRNRTPAEEDRPSINLRWHNSDPRPGQDFLNAWELLYGLDVSLEIDINLPPEDANEDITGWDILTAIAITAVRALIEEDGPMSLVCDDIVIGAKNPDDSASTPDNGRLEQVLTVLYRVLTRDPGTLLARGENGG